jgi:hypothetical protein
VLLNPPSTPLPLPLPFCCHSLAVTNSVSDSPSTRNGLFLRPIYFSSFEREVFIAFFSLKPAVSDGENCGTNDVHCALLASGQCIGIGFVPFLLSVLSFFIISLGLETWWFQGSELWVWEWSWDQLQFILHLTIRLVVGL